MGNGCFLFLVLIHLCSVLYCNDIKDVVDLPLNHIQYFFTNFPEVSRRCHEDNDCPYKEITGGGKCWGYEDSCTKNAYYSWPNCPGSHKGWVKTRSQQEETFYTQGDFGYVKEQRNSIMVICEPFFKDDSALECSKHLQFCRGRNLLLNLTRLLDRKEYFRYKMDVLSDGDIGGHCKLYKKRLVEELDHLSPLQSWAPELRYFTEYSYIPIAEKKCDIIFDKPTFIMKIDATVNMYHHLCDFLNLYASLHVNSSHWSTYSRDVHIIIWETFPYHSNFGDLFTAFTSNPILTLKDIEGKTVCFKNVVFPLLPRMIFGLYYNTPLIYGCEKSGLFHAFSEFILHRLNIPLHNRNDSKLHITFLSRETSYRNILNEAELISALNNNSQVRVRRVVFGLDINFLQQLEIIRNTDIIIGIHGAGLTHLLFLPDWAGIFEIYNCEDENCYLDLSRLRGVKYITWKDHKKLFQQDEGHHPSGGSHAKFTNYAFDKTEFLKLVDILVKHVSHHPQFIKFTTKSRHDEL